MPSWRVQIIPPPKTISIPPSPSFTVCIFECTALNEQDGSKRRSRVTDIPDCQAQIEWQTHPDAHSNTQNAARTRKGGYTFLLHVRRILCVRASRFPHQLHHLDLPPPTPFQLHSIAHVHDLPSFEASGVSVVASCRCQYHLS